MLELEATGHFHQTWSIKMLVCSNSIYNSNGILRIDIFRQIGAKLSLLLFQKRKQKHREIFKRAEKYVREHRRRIRDEVRMKRDAAKAGNFYVPDEPRLAFVVRIRGVNQIHPRPRKVLQLFRLRQINNGVFVKLNKVSVVCSIFMSTVNCHNASAIFFLLYSMPSCLYQLFLYVCVCFGVYFVTAM